MYFAQDRHTCNGGGPGSAPGRGQGDLRALQARALGADPPRLGPGPSAAAPAITEESLCKPKQGGAAPQEGVKPPGPVAPSPGSSALPPPLGAFPQASRLDGFGPGSEQSCRFQPGSSAPRRAEPERHRAALGMPPAPSALQACPRPTVPARLSCRHLCSRVATTERRPCSQEPQTVSQLG